MRGLGESIRRARQRVSERRQVRAFCFPTIPRKDAEWMGHTAELHVSELGNNELAKRAPIGVFLIGELRCFARWHFSIRL